MRLAKHSRRRPTLGSSALSFVVSCSTTVLCEKESALPATYALQRSDTLIREDEDSVKRKPAFLLGIL